MVFQKRLGMNFTPHIMRRQIQPRYDAGAGRSLALMRPNLNGMQGNGKLWNWVKTASKKVGNTTKKAFNNPVGKAAVGLYKKYVAPELKNRILAPILGSKTDMVENMAKDLVSGKSVKSIVKDTINDQINEALSPVKTALTGKGMKRLSDLMDNPQAVAQNRRIHALKPVDKAKNFTRGRTVQKASGTQDLIADEI